MIKMQQILDGTELFFVQASVETKTIALLEAGFCFDLQFFLIEFILTNLANSLRIAELKRRL